MIQVILPVLDEAGALPWVLGRFPSGFTPLVVDNGSTDGSVQIARSLGADVVVEPRRGFGAACARGLAEASTDVVCFMDCDASLDPRELPEIAGPVVEGAADLVIGSRRPDRGAWPLRARIANRYLARVVNRRSDTALTDIGPMRATRRDGLMSLMLADRRSGYPFEMVLKAAAEGWTIIEVPVRYRRRTGRSKVTGTVGGTLRAVRDIGQVLS